MRFRNDVANAATGVASDFFKLRSRLIDNWRNFFHLLVGQAKLPLKPHFHGPSRRARRMLGKHKMMADRHRHKNTSGTAGDEDQKETGDQFPFQRAVHWATSS